MKWLMAFVAGFVSTLACRRRLPGLPHPAGAFPRKSMPMSGVDPKRIGG